MAAWRYGAPAAGVTSDPPVPNPPKTRAKTLVPPRQRPVGPTNVRCTQPLKLAASTLTNPFSASPVATNSSTRCSVATTVLSMCSLL